jgi:hypothetical protein
VTYLSSNGLSVPNGCKIVNNKQINENDSFLEVQVFYHLEVDNYFNCYQDSMLPILELKSSK